MREQDVSGGTLVEVIDQPQRTPLGGVGRLSVALEINAETRGTGLP
jgi:hypothetical protein